MEKEAKEDVEEDRYWDQLDYMSLDDLIKKPNQRRDAIRMKFLLEIPFEPSDYFPDPPDKKYFWDLIMFRPCEEKHLPGIMALDRENFSDPWSMESWQHELKMENPRAIWYVAEAEGHIAGYAGIWIAADEVQLMRIAVRKRLRNMGIAGHLLDMLVGEAELENAVGMTLEVRESNDTARKFYEHYGFVSRGIRPNYYSNPREGAVIMWLDFPAEDLAERMKLKGSNKEIPVT